MVYIWAGALAVTMNGVPDLFLAIIPHPLITNSAFIESSFTFGESSPSGVVKKIFFWLISPGGHYVSSTQRTNHRETL